MDGDSRKRTGAGAIAFLRLIAGGAVWQAAVLLAFLCGGGSVGGESDREPDLVEVFSVWAGGMAVEITDVLEGAANAEGGTRGKTGGSGCVRRLRRKERGNAETQSARSFEEEANIASSYRNSVWFCQSAGGPARKEDGQRSPRQRAGAFRAKKWPGANQIVATTIFGRRLKMPIPPRFHPEVVRRRRPQQRPERASFAAWKSRQ